MMEGGAMSQSTFLLQTIIRDFADFGFRRAEPGRAAGGAGDRQRILPACAEAGEPAE